jgi:uncharacterized protein (DUF2267 family)
MSATGLDVFDKTLQTTNTWLNEICQLIGPDRQIAWHVLGAVLRTLRDRLPLGLGAHLGAELPLLVRGVYYDQWRPAAEPLKIHTAEDFLDHIAKDLSGIRPVNVNKATGAVFRVLNHHVNPDQIEKVREALPRDIRDLWPAAAATTRSEPAT